MLSKKLGFRSWSIMYRSRPGSMSHIGGWIGYGSWSSCGSITRSKVSITISRSGVIHKYKSI